MKTSHLFNFALAFGLFVASFAMTVLLFSNLPAQIPIHFNFSGTPDAWTTKELAYVFMVPLLHLLIALLFLIIYRYPQYMSWPTTLLLMTVAEEKREAVFEVLRSMLITTLFTLSVFFTYLQFVILATANNRLGGVNQYAMLTFMAVLILVLILYNGKIFFLVRRLTKK